MRRGFCSTIISMSLAVNALGGPLVTARASAEPVTNLPKPQKSSASVSQSSSPSAYPIECSVAGGIIEAKPRTELPPPSAEQLLALSLLSREVDTYQAEGREFSHRLTTIVRHHYEERRRRVLAALDEEIRLENQTLEFARTQAIERLETFIARYSGDRADPQATPDAMFRLAALYEEKAREDLDADLGQALQPAIQLYMSAAFQYPGYKELAAVLYYLGHALNDASRFEEAQTAFRSLVCQNRYQTVPSPTDSTRLSLEPLPQDHDQKFWEDWHNKNPVPFDQVVRRQPLDRTLTRDEELTFIDPYADCSPVQGTAIEGDEPRYVAEVWWQIGNYHFDQLGAQGGPYELNRASSAYEHSLQFKKPPLYGVAMYKQAWTLFKQQRYEAAVRRFVDLLHYADEQQAKTGDPGADFRAEAYTYIAGSLTYVDFAGPPATDPYIARSDALDLEQDPLEAERKMAVAIERVQNPALVPQDKTWTVEIYKALAQEYVEINQNANAVTVLSLAVQKFPMDRDAPVMVNRIAELYDAQQRLLPQGAPARAEFAEKALAARTELSKFIGDTEWTRANKDDPEALTQAEELVRTGLRRAAADHTNFARAFKDRAFELSDPRAQRDQLEKAIAEYQLAGQGWRGYLERDVGAHDAYESRFWLADALFWSTVLQVPLGRVPSDAEVEEARAMSSAVRDSNEDDRYKQPAAYYVVTLAEKVLDAAAQAFEESGGSQGIARREEVAFSGVGAERAVSKERLPNKVEAAVCARDEYNARIPLVEDPEHNGLMYATQAAEYFFVYGQFAEARRRLQPIFEQYCGKNEWGYNAWEKLVSMSNFEGNAAESRRLVEGKSCAFDPETRLAEEAIRTPVRQGVAYMEARALFEKARKMADGPERDKTWRAAAAAYKVALDTAPDRDDAPEAAMNSAYAYKQVGEYEKAIGAYSLFIEQYGNDAVLSGLKKGDAARYQERVGFVRDAYQALAGAYVLFFDYPKAAKTFDTMSTHPHFPTADRKEAARQALTLYANLDDRQGLDRTKKVYANLDASDESRAEAAFLVASASLKTWDPKSSDSGANKNARLMAENAMEQYYTQHRGKRGADRFVVRAAYYVALSREIGKSAGASDWWKKTITAFESFANNAPKKGGKSAALGSEEASMAAEADYRGIDVALKAGFDYDTGHHRYKGTVVEVTQAYTKDAAEAKTWYEKLGTIVDKYASQKWAAVAVARQGSVYDSLRTGLYNTRPPELKMFTPEQERALKAAESSDDDALIDKADQIRLSVNEAWRQKRDTELDSADRIVVDRYGTATLLARRYNVSDASLTRALRRLAFLTEVTGEAKMAEYTASLKDLSYSPGMFQRMRPGLLEMPTVDPLPYPHPSPFESRTPGAPRGVMSGGAQSAYEAGVAAYDRGDLAGAKTQLEKATSADPKAASAFVALGAVRERSDDPSGAQAAYRSALAGVPGYEPALYNLGVSFARSGNVDAASSLLESARASAPASAPVLGAIGELRSIGGRSGEAQALAQEALRKDPEFRNAMVTLARDHYRARRIDLALYTLQGIVEGYGEGNPPRDRNAAEAWLLRGLIYAERSMRGQAVENLSQALKLRPDLSLGQWVLGVFLLESGNAKEAVPHLEMAVRYETRNPKLHAVLGDAYRLLDRPADARRELEWALSAAPNDPGPNYTLGLLFLTSKSIPGMTPKQAAERAISHLEAYKKRVTRGGPDDVDELIARAKTKLALIEAESN